LIDVDKRTAYPAIADASYEETVARVGNGGKVGEESDGGGRFL